MAQSLLVPHHLGVERHAIKTLLRSQLPAHIDQRLAGRDKRRGDAHMHDRGALGVGEAAHALFVHNASSLGGLRAEVQGEVSHQHAVTVHLTGVNSGDI